MSKVGKYIMSGNILSESTIEAVNTKGSVRMDPNRIKSIDDFVSPEALHDELIASIRKYHPSADISMIEKAYQIASEAHKVQKRISGEPYIIHPLQVAIIL